MSRDNVRSFNPKTRTIIYEKYVSFLDCQENIDGVKSNVVVTDGTESRKGFSTVEVGRDRVVKEKRLVIRHVCRHRQ